VKPKVTLFPGFTQEQIEAELRRRKNLLRHNQQVSAKRDAKTKNKHRKNKEP
jgi:hypothetical protein